MLDGGDDSLEDAPDLAGDPEERLQSAAFSRAAPGPEIRSRFVGFDDPIEVSEPLFQLPGPPEPIAGSPEAVGQGPVLLPEEPIRPRRGRGGCDASPDR